MRAARVGGGRVRVEMPARRGRRLRSACAGRGGAASAAAGKADPERAEGCSPAGMRHLVAGPCKPGAPPLASVDVAVIGGGFSGANLSTHLLRSSAALGRPVTVAMIERQPRQLFRGVAYSTPNSASHVLNFTAKGTIAVPDDPTSFVRFMAKLKGCDEDTAANEHTPRWHFGSYVRHELHRAAAQAARSTACASGCTTIVGEATRVRACEDSSSGTGGVVVLRGGAEVRARWVVLATGNDQPSDPPVARGAWHAHSGYRRDVWAWMLEGQGEASAAAAGRGRDGARTGERVGAAAGVGEAGGAGTALLVGSSLTAVDACLELLDRRFVAAPAGTTAALSHLSGLKALCGRVFTRSPRVL